MLDESRTQAERITQMHTDALNNEMEARREYWQLAQNRQERIGKLLRENFVYRLLIQRKDTQIAKHRRTAHKLTVRYNNDTERWRRRHAGCVRQMQNWKGQYRNSQNQVQARDQNILNLQQQILALQNNPPNIQRIGMAGYPPPKFHGTAGEDPADYIRDLRQWCEASPNHDPNAGHQHRIRIDGLFESGLKDYAKDWYDIEIKGRNWELQNISDNTGIANIGAINGLANNNALRAINANQFRGGALHTRNTVPADNNAIANPIVPGHTIWEEDWSISGGRPTLLAPNAPNANAGGNTIAPGMFVGQKIYTFLHDFPTITAEKSKVKFQNLVQGNDPVGRFYANLKRMVKLAFPLLPAVN